MAFPIIDFPEFTVGGPIIDHHLGVITPAEGGRTRQIRLTASPISVLPNAQASSVSGSLTGAITADLHFDPHYPVDGNFPVVATQPIVSNNETLEIHLAQQHFEAYALTLAAGGAWGAAVLTTDPTATVPPYTVRAIWLYRPQS